MENKIIEVNNKKPINGMGVMFLNIFAELLGVALIIFSAIEMDDEFGIYGILIGIGCVIVLATLFIYPGLRIVHPNCALVLTLFGDYYRTIDKAGFYFVNPFSAAINPEFNAIVEQRVSDIKAENTANVSTKLSKEISLKAMTLDNGVQKVNDVLGNPIVIGAVVIWRVSDPTKAVLNVENFKDYLSIQTDSTVRNIARLYPYDLTDDIDDDVHAEKTLRGSSLEIAESMKLEFEKRAESAGITIEEVRITHLAYSEEIAAAMLQRQQAAAVIAARQKIVDGAVSMVKMAIDKLGDEEIVILDEERKAQMVSNLMVVLCSSKDTQPIINSGSIY
ncbi:MAG: SPFH domain-containing protein [Ruminococcus sp.]|nr:SPFH domain-containing protein [Ruminococcus sp.]